MNMRIIWINPVHESHTVSDLAANDRAVFPTVIPHAIVAAGTNSTLVWSGVSTLGLWGLTDTKYYPLRLSQRDDGLGVEQSPRNDSMKSNNWSSANASPRIFNQGDGTYR